MEYEGWTLTLNGKNYEVHPTEYVHGVRIDKILFWRIPLGTYPKQKAFDIRKKLKKQGILCILRGRGKRTHYQTDLTVPQANKLAVYAYAKILSEKEKLAYKI